jgi:hypothetical protein
MKKHLVTIWSASLLAVFLFSGCSHSSPDARTTPATESIKGQYITAEQLVDAGNTTPEAALESLFWATANGNYDSVIASFVPQVRKEAKGWYGDKTKFVASNFASFKGLQILARKIVADDKVELKYHFEKPYHSPGQTTTNTGAVTKIVLLVKMGSAWEFPDNQSRSYETNWDEGSQPEPQP